MFIKEPLWPEPLGIFILQRILNDSPSIPSEQSPLRKIVLFKLKIFCTHMIYPNVNKRAPSQDFFHNSLDVRKLFHIGEGGKTTGLATYSVQLFTSARKPIWLCDGGGKNYVDGTSRGI
jgi:hypothetical protein